MNAAVGPSIKQTFFLIVSLQLLSAFLIITCIKPCVPLPQVMITGLPVVEVGVPPTIVQL